MCELPVPSYYTRQKRPSGGKLLQGSMLLGQCEAEHHSVGNMWQRNFAMADRKQRGSRSRSRCSSQGSSPAQPIPTSNLSPPPCHGSLEEVTCPLGQTSASPLSTKTASQAPPEVCFSISWGLLNPMKLTVKSNPTVGQLVRWKHAGLLGTNDRNPRCTEG